eukprot:scaffold2789_cov297-Prasinococcus_capsulatus_cf.AAC.4
MIDWSFDCCAGARVRRRRAGLRAVGGRGGLRRCAARRGAGAHVPAGAANGPLLLASAALGRTI